MKVWSGLTAIVACLVFGSLASAATITHGATTINMDFVTVGNPGNAPDSTGYGAVADPYQIGKYEVTENQWDAVVAANTMDLLNDPGYWTGDRPVAAISWYEAAMFCNWLTSGDVRQGVYAVNESGVVTGIDRVSAQGNYRTIYFLPTENEWYKAAYYDPNTNNYYDYPTASNTVPDGIDSSTDTAWDAVFYDGYDQRHPNDVTNAGIASPYGTIGQGGNVWEWNETAIGSSRGLRGGAFNNNSNNLASSNRNNNNPTTMSLSRIDPGVLSRIDPLLGSKEIGSFLRVGIHAFFFQVAVLASSGEVD